MTDTDSLLRIVLLVVLAVVFLPFLLMMILMPMTGLFGWIHMGNGGMWGGTVGWLAWLLMMIIPLLLLAGIGYAVYRLLVTGSSTETDEAMEALRLAYARGELSDEEFETRRKRLQQQNEQT